MKKHYKSVFENEQELLKAIIDIHLDGKDIEADFTYFKGNFYKDGVNRPKYCYDIKPLFNFVKEQDNTIYYLGENENKLKSIIIDPPFMFGIHGKSDNFYSSKTHGIYPDFSELEDSYIGFLRNAFIQLDKKGICIFKCQDYTDGKTTLTHNFVCKWAEETGFYIKDLAILVKPNKVYNGNTKQRHLRKIHTYFFVLEKTNKKPCWYRELEQDN